MKGNTSMSNVSALRRAVVVTAASALAVSAIMVSGAASASAAVSYTHLTLPTT